MSNWFHKTRISKAANSFATKSYVDESLRDAFAKGVDWSLQQFLEILRTSAHEYDPSVKKLADNYRLKEFENIVTQLTKTEDEK